MEHKHILSLLIISIFTLLIDTVVSAQQTDVIVLPSIFLSNINTNNQMVVGQYNQYYLQFQILSNNSFEGGSLNVVINYDNTTYYNKTYPLTISAYSGYISAYSDKFVLNEPGDYEIKLEVKSNDTNQKVIFIKNDKNTTNTFDLKFTVMTEKEFQDYLDTQENLRIGSQVSNMTLILIILTLVSVMSSLRSIVDVFKFVYKHSREALLIEAIAFIVIGLLYLFINIYFFILNNLTSVSLVIIGICIMFFNKRSILYNITKKSFKKSFHFDIFEVTLLGVLSSIFNYQVMQISFFHLISSIALYRNISSNMALVLVSLFDVIIMILFLIFTIANFSIIWEFSLKLRNKISLKSKRKHIQKNNRKHGLRRQR